VKLFRCACRYRRKLGDGLHLLFNSDGKSANDYLIKLSKCAEWYHLDKAICIIKKYGEANHDLRRVALHLDAVRFLVQERHNIQAGQSDFPTGTLERSLAANLTLPDRAYICSNRWADTSGSAGLFFLYSGHKLLFWNEESVEPQPIVNLLENWKKLRTELEGVMGNLTQDEKWTKQRRIAVPCGKCFWRHAGSSGYDLENAEKIRETGAWYQVVPRVVCSAKTYRNDLKAFITKSIFDVQPILMKNIELATTPEELLNCIRQFSLRPSPDVLSSVAACSRRSIRYSEWWDRKLYREGDWEAGRDVDAVDFCRSWWASWFCRWSALVIAIPCLPKAAYKLLTAPDSVQELKICIQAGAETVRTISDDIIKRRVEIEGVSLGTRNNLKTILDKVEECTLLSGHCWFAQEVNKDYVGGRYLCCGCINFNQQSILPGLPPCLCFSAQSTVMVFLPLPARLLQYLPLDDREPNWFQNITTFVK